ncbi:unnamed protein product [Choristocarpus tenellus]
MLVCVCQGGLSSEGFAHLAAAVLLARGFRVFLMGGLAATPLVSFGVTLKRACAGIMVTASHNPKGDNGYKVYWGEGSQIIPPHDAGIARSIGECLEPWQVYDLSGVRENPRCSDPVKEISDAYYVSIQEQLCRRAEDNACSNLRVIKNEPSC